MITFQPFLLVSSGSSEGNGGVNIVTILQWIARSLKDGSAAFEGTKADQGPWE
jgi:hypothetical protein